MNNEELLEKLTERLEEKLEDKLEEKFKRHIGVLIEHNDKKIETIGEGHSTLLRKIDEFRSEFQEHKEITERGLDRLTITVEDIKESLATVTKKHDQRLKRVEEKVSL